MTRHFKSFLPTHLLVFIIWTNSHTNCTSINRPVTEQLSESKVCTTDACQKIATEILEKMNRNIDPCDDFYEYVCGNFSKNAVIPDDQPERDIFGLYEKKVEQELKQSMENDILESDPRTFKILQSYYNTCMDIDLAERSSEKEFLELLSELGEWPVLRGESWNESDFDWQETVLKFCETGFACNYFIDFLIAPNISNNNQLIIKLNQASLGIPKEYLLKGLNDKIVKAYFKYMVDLAEIFGANRSRAEKELNESLKFEIELAKISQQYNYYNFMTLDKIQSNYSFVSWLEYVNRIMHPYAEVKSEEVVSLGASNFFGNLSVLIDKTPQRVLANYAFWRVVQESAVTLSERVKLAGGEFYASLSGNSDKRPRWEECVNHVNKNMYIATGALYVRKYFNKKSKEDMLDMTWELKNSFRQILSEVVWMKNDTKKETLEKLDKMVPLVAYPDELLDDEILDEYHKDLKIDSKSFLKTMLNYNIFAHKYYVESLRKPMQKDDWTNKYRAAAKINAYYYPLKNALVFPGGILQGAFFNVDHPKYLNYGGVGFLVGHEMTHGFDEQSRHFDKNGNYIKWWDPESEEAYANKTKCIVEQYGNYTVTEVNLKVDGMRTKNENIADQGGLRISYNAYDAWQKINGEESRLPGFESFTSKQMFWISYANVWCAKYRPQILEYYVLGDTHVPAKLRIVGSVSNIPEFSKNFNCAVGSTMNPTNKCSFW